MLTIIFAAFEVLFNFLYGVVKFILRILTYFGLIIPLFYYILMLIIRYLVVGIEAFEPYNIWYYIGLGVSFVLCILYFLRMVLFKKQKPPKFSWNKKEKSQGKEIEHSPLIPSGNIIQERVFKDPNGNIVQERTFQLPDGEKYKSYQTENTLKSKSPEIYETPKYDFKTIEAPKAQLKLIDNYSEEPEIYRVKNNKQFIIKEYSDRVEVYKETPSGYEFIKCDYK